MRFIIRAAEPFSGLAESILLKDGTVAFTNGDTLEDLEDRLGCGLRVVEDSEFDELLARYAGSQITEPVAIEEDAWQEALNVLPPCRWQHVQGVELFHVSERISHDLVHWYARLGHSTSPSSTWRTALRTFSRPRPRLP